MTRRKLRKTMKRIGLGLAPVMRGAVKASPAKKKHEEESLEEPVREEPIKEEPVEEESKGFFGFGKKKKKS